ncbi:hypothetical protein LTR04_007302 [Oleoguttula sp. CCFEE 6159]|nr:hypothetical protein LTR04_007302 [Oleoguttula sp. CCFEE 6159]
MKASRASSRSPSPSSKSPKSRDKSRSSSATRAGSSHSPSQGGLEDTSRKRRVIDHAMGGHVIFSEAEAAAIFDALEQKRRQLDEQIHRYRAQKDKEYRLFERQLRSKHRARKEGTSSSTISGPEEATGGYFSHRADEDNGNPDDVGDDVSSAHDREKEFLGVFTQNFLPLLDDFRGTRSGTQSAPMLSPNIPKKDDICKPERSMLQRANTGPPAYGQPAKKAPVVSEATQSTHLSNRSTYIQL